MTGGAKRGWRSSFRPGRLLASLSAGLVAGVMTISLSISFGALVFSGDLSAYTARGIGLALFSAAVVGFSVAVTSSYSGSVANPQGSPAVILAVIATGIVAAISPGVGPPVPSPALPPAPPTAGPPMAGDAFPTVVVALGLAALITGLFFVLLGVFNLGGLIRYVPYPVVGGFLSATGWLLARKAMGVMVGPSFPPAHGFGWLHPGTMVRWLPGVVFAVVLVIILRRQKHALILPGMLVAAILLFYLMLWGAGVPVAEAQARGWFLGPFPDEALWPPLSPVDLARVDWRAIVRQAGGVGTILVISAVSLLLRVSSLEVIARSDFDLNRELKSAGLANVIAGLGGGFVSYHSLSLSTLSQRTHATSRLVGIVCSLLCAGVLALEIPVAAFFPRPILGGLLLFLGLGFLVEWLYDAWFRLSRRDYLIVWLILIAINTVGVLEGVGVGVVLAVVLFVVDYSRIDVVKHVLSGKSFQSNVDRPRLYAQLLREKGDWLYVLELQGFLFFGTANKLLAQVKERIEAPDLPAPHFVVLDFRQVTGLDGSAAFAFVRMKHLAQAHSIVLVFTHLSPDMTRQLEREVFVEQDRGTVWRTFVDLDRGVEWCEERIVETFEEVGLVAKPRSVRQRLGEFLKRPARRSGRVDKLLDLLTADEGQQAATTEPEPGSVDSMMRYIQRMAFDEGDYLIRQGEPPQGMYFIEEGQVTVRLEYEEGHTLRLRTMERGTIVGELGLYMDSVTKTSASVVADVPTVAYHLSAEDLKRMEREEPETAAALHRYVVQIVGERLLNTMGTLRALLE